MNKKFWLFVFGFLVLAQNVLAGQCGVYNAQGATTTIMFVNGINNSQPMACQSSNELILKMATNGVAWQKYNWTYFHNQNSGLGSDIVELRLQATRSNAALEGAGSGQSVEAYYQKLGEIYNSAIFGGNLTEEVDWVTRDLYNKVVEIVETKGQSLVIVPHSQGNFYTEAVYALLKFKGKTNVIQKLRVVGVGVVAATSPSDKYISSEVDNALSTQQLQTHSYAPGAIYLNKYNVLSRTDNPCTGTDSFKKCGQEANLNTGDKWLGHGFVEIYLSGSVYSEVKNKAYSAVIAGMVQDSINDLTPSQPVTFANLVTTPSYDLFTDDTYGQCYSKSVGSASGSNTYTMTESKYCLSGGQWVARTLGDTQILGDYGVLYPESSKILKDTGNNTYSVSYGSRAYLSGSFSQKATGVYTHTLTQTASMYYFNFNSNSYIYNNVSSLGALITNYNCANNSGYLSTGGQYGVMLCGSASDTNGITRYFAVGDSSRTIVDRGTWSKLSFSNGVALIGLGDNSTIVTGDSNITLAYLKMPSESGVREGGSIKIGRTQSWDSYNRAAFDSFLAGKGWPATVN